MGRGGIGIVRISGPKTKDIAMQLFGKLPKAREACFSKFYDEHHQVVDEGVALFFSAPHSYTGEDVLELQGHGSPVVIEALIKRIENAGARLAKPGEFTERAFLNDKMDLVQAEAVADLIDANSTQAARSALRSLQGEFSKRIQQLLDQLIHLRMEVEAAIDFPEEEIDFIAENNVQNKLEILLQFLQHILASATQGAILREGLYVVIAGKPNAGKSSLLNCLTQKDSAIVTEIAGTTRDVLREQIHIDGLPIHIIDTAGLRETTDVIEQEGVRRAEQEIHKADLILYVIDGAHFNLADIDIKQYAAPVVYIKNKIDVLEEAAEVIRGDDKTIIKISAKNNQGIEHLKQFIKEFAGYSANEETIIFARERHLQALRHTDHALKHAYLNLAEYRAYELLAEDLRLAQKHLSEITGEFTSDDLLGKIFSSFCIGK